MPLTFPTIISFKVISKAHNTESKTPYISGRILWKAFSKGPHFLQICSLNYLTSYSQHPPPLSILMTGDLLHNPWGQNSFLYPLNPELCPNSRACNCLHSFLSTFTSFFGCLPSPSLPHTRTLGPWLFPSLGSALAFLHSTRTVRERTLKWEKLDLNSGCYPFPPSVLGLFYIAGLKMLGNS